MSQVKSNIKRAGAIFGILLCLLPFINEAQSSNKGYSVEIAENKQFNGKDLEAKFKISCINQSTKTKRNFEVIKTNGSLLNFFLADYIMVEKINSKTQYYPLGWSGTKISEKDIKLNCQAIIKGEVNSVVPD